MTACPACGVPIVPGYVRCPKCHVPLPTVSRTRTGQVAGGTTLEKEDTRFPIGPVILGVALAGGIVAFFGLRSSGGGAQSPVAAPTQPTRATATAPAAAEPEPGAEAPTPRAPDPNAVANELDRLLDKQRLWSTVEVVGTRIDVRSGSCNDPNMANQLDVAQDALRAAGLTKLRCVEQSGVVVLERDLR
ncbi:MAG: hypothetical protein AB7P03_10355 [Kofleriaceae bacterium]